MKVEVQNLKFGVHNPEPGVQSWNGGPTILTKHAGKVRAFALVDLLVVLVMLGVLAGLLLPSLGRGKERARSAQCLSNLHQLGGAVLLYAKEHEGRLPAAER